MNEKTFKKRLNKMEKTLYNDIFLKNISINDVLKKGLKKHITFILFANIRFNLFHNCLLKAIKENIFEDDLKTLNSNITKICIHLDEIINIINEIFDTENIK